MKGVFDTRFFVTYFFSKSEEELERARALIRLLRRKGNAGLIPTIVLHEIYAIECRTRGLEVAKIRLNSLKESHFKIVPLSVELVQHSGTLKCKYHGVPAADTIIAATYFSENAKFVVTDDPHFEQMQVKTRWISIGRK